MLFHQKSFIIMLSSIATTSIFFRSSRYHHQRVSAFVPLVGRTTTKTSAATTTVSKRNMIFIKKDEYYDNEYINKHADANIRRTRPKYSSKTLLPLIHQLAKTDGKYKDFGQGFFMLSSTQSSTDVNTDNNQQQQQSSNKIDYTNILPTIFPLEGLKQNEIPIRMRFAPSPTGSLHVGGARTALYNYLVAKKAQYDYPNTNAAFILRVEDTDVARSTKESEDSVLADLKWLGLNWDEGPDIDQHIANYGPYRQSERTDVYLSAVRRLIDTGNAYYCFTTQEELDEMKAQQEAAGQVFRYDGRWRDADPELVNKMIDQEKPFTVRFKVQPGSRVVIDDIVRGTVSWDAEANVGDFILLRSSGIPVYNFCVAVDDASMGVATVVRAEEHLTNTLRQALILDALGAPRPRYAHCSLILGEDKQKLSKRHGATSCDQYRLDGFLPDAMINYLALLGWSDGTENEIFTREELIDAFDLHRVNKSPSVFDIEKLKWVNGQHIKMLSVSNLIPYVKDQFVLENILKDDISIDTNQQLHDLAFASTSIAKQMMLTTKDAVTNAKTVFSYNLPKTYDTIEDKEANDMIEQGTFYILAKKILEQYDAGVLPIPSSTDALAAFQDASGEAIEEDDKKGETCEYTHNYISHMKSLAKEMKIKGKLFFHPIRLMLTGEMSGQDVTKQMSLLALATGSDSVVDKKKGGVVSLAKRMEKLRSFIETIPEQYRQPLSPEQVAAAAAAVVSAQNPTVVNGVSTSSSTTTTTGESAIAQTMVSADPKDTYTGPRISALDIRVGRIIKVWEHEDADKLFCEEIDVGEDQPRCVASGLRPYMTTTDLENRLVLVLCNLKERKLAGFPSHGMVLCASNSEHTHVTLVNPPIDAKIGERVTIPDMEFTSVTNEEDYAPFGENQIAKKKVFESIAPYLLTNKYGVPEFLGRPFMTSAGICTSSIPDGTVS